MTPRSQVSAEMAPLLAARADTGNLPRLAGFRLDPDQPAGRQRQLRRQNPGLALEKRYSRRLESHCLNYSEIIPNVREPLKTRLDNYLVAIADIEEKTRETLPVTDPARTAKPATSWVLPTGCDQG